MSAPVDVFRWIHDDVVLLASQEAETFVVARAWRRGDALTDVRRWRFGCRRRAGGQVRRLVRETTSDDRLGQLAMAAFLTWSDGQPDETMAKAAAEADVPRPT